MLSQSQRQQLADTIENNARLAVDDQEHDLAESRYNMGRRPTITRTTAGAHPCEWCQSYAGVYAYGPDMDKAHAFGRHNNCACLIEYDPGTGKTETVRNYRLGSRNREQLMKRDAEHYGSASGRAMHTYDDPIREKIGSAFDSHPKEVDGLLEQLKERGVRVIYKDGVMGYFPSARYGEPGTLKIDKAASYSAWLHEMRHQEDDFQSGWKLAKAFGDPDAFIEIERRAYNVELEFARSAGYNDIVERLEKLKAEAEKRIRDEYGI